MRLIYLTIAYLILFCSMGNAQLIPEFSPLSGNDSFNSEFIKHDGEYFLVNQYSNPEFTIQIYKISEQAVVLDSINIRESENMFFSTLRSIDDKLFLGGIKSEPNSQRYIVAELDSDFSIIQKYESPLFDTLISPTVNGGTGQGTFSQLFDFTVFEDTCYFTGRYFLFDTLNINIGIQQRYFKAIMDGNSLDVLIDRPVAGTAFNLFFKENQLYFQGSNLEGPPFLPPAVGFYDSSGNFTEGWDFDDNGSGAFPWGSCGGVIDDKLYFSYRGDDTSLDGCSDETVAIDVRDVNFNILHRFKVEECNYSYAGNMPYCQAVDGNIYFQAKSTTSNTVLIKKFTSDMAGIWSREFDFSANNSLTINPIKMVPADDGGVILHAFEGFSFVRLYKISPDGDIISSTSFGNKNELATSTLSPNPFINELYYTGESRATLEAYIYSMDGRISKRRLLNGDVLEVSDLPNGLYSILIKDKSESEVVLHQEILVKME